MPVQSKEEKLTYRSRDDRPKTWKDIWGAGQGVGDIDSVLPAGELVERIVAEYEAAKAKITSSGNHRYPENRFLDSGVRRNDGR